LAEPGFLAPGVSSVIIMNGKSYYTIGLLHPVETLIWRLCIPVACCLGITVGVSRAEQAAAPNLDSRLLGLAQHAKLSVPDAGVAGPHSQIAKVSATDKLLIHGRFDDLDRVLVHVMLNGQDSLDNVAGRLESLQGHVLDRNSTYRHGVISAYLPTDQLENAAATLGVRSMTMEYPPEVRKIGKYSSQARFVLQTNVLNKAGLTGNGITIGALSDSFNTAQFGTPPPATTAAQDVKLGYLPSVNVLQDYGGPGTPGTDEGRAILQVVYSEAIDCQEAFATAFVSEVGFANNIVALRTQANCAVIDDDVGYYDEPVFSDGMVADAVNTVVTSTTLPGVPVIYTSSAGNDGNNGYRSAYRELRDSFVRQTGNHGNLQLENVPAALTAGGWHNWNPNTGSEPSTAIEAPGPVNPAYVYAIFLQWDDLFDQDHGVTTNYNFLVFDADGNYLPALSSTTNAFSVQQPIQGIGYLSLGTVYQIAVTKTTQTDKKAGPIPATHQLAMYTTLDGLSNVTGTYFQPAPLSVPNLYGHPAADSAIAVAAYAFNWRANKPYLPTLDNFTSPGPVFIYFDQNQNRLSTPVTRLKPEVAGADGVLTTFFGSPYYDYPFAFFGTSCAGPTVAGVAALMLEAAGGPGSLDAATVKTALENTAAPRTTTPEITQGLKAVKGGYVSVSALGQSYFGPNYFTLNYFGPAGQTIDSLTIDGSTPGLIFNTKTGFVIGSTIGLSASDVTVEPASKDASKFTLKFKPGVFTSGVSISFTAEQDEAGKYPGYTQSEYGAGSDAEDLGYGATFTVNLTTGTSTETVTVPFQAGSPSTGYGVADGYGLINAVAAVQAITPTAKPAAAK
jgi:Subtilase family